MTRGLLFIVLAACGRVGFDGGGANDAASGDAPGADAAATVTFSDDFDRTAGDPIGNAWIEKTPAVFAIQNNVVTRTIEGDWTSNQVYRPPNEDLRDVEVAMGLIVRGVADPDWPQVFVRGEPSVFAGYYLWLENGPTTGPSTIDLARKGAAESWWTGLDSTLAPAAQVGDRYRLRLRAVGAAPVVVDGYYEKWNGAGWDTLISLHGEDTSPDAIVGAGTWGFDGHVGTATGPYAYDNFTATAL